MSPLTPAGAADLQSFAAAHGATYLTDSDPVFPERWTNPDRAQLISWMRQHGLHIPNSLSRQDIFRTGRGPGSAAQLFLWTMMWGYQSNGAGAWRTERATLTPAFGSKLLAWINFATVNNLTGAYQAMINPHSKIHRIGLAFASKLWYFAGYDESKTWPLQPLILDSRVHASLQATTFRHIPGPLLDPSRHHFARQQPSDVSLTDLNYYLWYLKLAVEIRDAYIPGHRVDLVEFWLFMRANDI